MEETAQHCKKSIALKKSADILPDAGYAFLTDSSFWALFLMQNGRFLFKKRPSGFVWDRIRPICYGIGSFGG